MTHVNHLALQHKADLHILTAISLALFVKTDSGTFEITRKCANPKCRSRTLDFSVEIINGLRVSKNGGYCSQACSEVCSQMGRNG